MTTHAAHSHGALERRDRIDALSDMADKLRDMAKDAKAIEAELSEAKLLLAMALDVMKRGDYHPSIQQQVAGVRSQIRGVLK